MQSSSVSYQKLNHIQRHDYQTLLSKKIGFGQAQSKISFALYALMFCQGCETIVITLIMPYLQKQWSLTPQDKSMLLMIVIIGTAVGHYVQSFADTYGRLPVLKWNAIIQIVFGLLSCVAPSFISFLVFRFFYGIAIGITLPLSGTYVCQFSPIKNRSIMIATTRISFGLGFLLTLFLSWYLLKQDNWRMLLFIICLPGVLSLWHLYRTGKQTLRYLWVNQRTQQSCQLIYYMLQRNNRQPLYRQQIQYSINKKQQNPTNKPIQTAYSDIFNQRNRPITLHLSIAWFTAAFVYNGLMLYLPIMLVKKNSVSVDSQYMAFIIIICFEISSYLFIQKILENEFFGRRRTLYITFLLTAVLAVVLILFGEMNSSFYVIIFMLMRITMSINCLTIVPYGTEIYSTMIRSKALGIIYLFGRIAVIVLGIVGADAMKWFGGDGFSMLIVVLCVIGGYSMYKIPYDTCGKELDFVE